MSQYMVDSPYRVNALKKRKKRTECISIGLPSLRAASNLNVLTVPYRA